jgi:hypothetical protein
MEICCAGMNSLVSQQREIHQRIIYLLIVRRISIISAEQKQACPALPSIKATPSFVSLTKQRRMTEHSMKKVFLSIWSNNTFEIIRLTRSVIIGRTDVICLHGGVIS